MPYGFTLVELVVVLVIVSSFLVLTVPVFRIGNLFSNPLQEAQSFGQSIASLKIQAVREHKDIFLHFETGTGRVWAADTVMTEPMTDSSGDRSVNLPENLHITGIELASDRHRQGPGTADIRIIRLSRHGYSDAAILNLSDGDIRVSLKIEPFFSRVEMIPDPFSFDDCVHGI